MAKFLAIHPVDPPVTREQADGVFAACKAGVSLDAYWVSSWLQHNADGLITKVFCEWDATSADAITASCTASIPSLPASDGIFPMSVVSGEQYRS